MCKHVAAALYGVGARLDERPELLFVLRNVDEHELLASAGQDLTLAQAAPSPAKMLEDGDLAALFGLEMAEPASPDDPGPSVPKPGQSSKRSKGMKALAGKKTRQQRRATHLALLEPSLRQKRNIGPGPGKCVRSIDRGVSRVGQGCSTLCSRGAARTAP